MTTTLVTGANRGIGLALCRELKARGDRLVAVVRRTSPELDAVEPDRVETGVEVTSAQAVAALAERLAGERIDVLIHNAGLLQVETFEALDMESIRRQLEVNALGPLQLTRALRPNLSRGSKLAFITSRMGSIGDNTSGGYYGYRMSKAALNMGAVSLARDLRPDGIAVAILHPGPVRTEMTAFHGTVEPEEAARGLLARIDELTLESSGSFWHMNGEQLPW